MKIIVWSPLAATIGAATQAFGAAGDNEPVRWHGDGQTAILHSNVGRTDLIVGDNPVGKPREFSCRSAAGCVVTMSVSVSEKNNNGSTSVCSYVDGVPGVPGCGPDPAYYGYDTMSNARQQLRVGQGSHTITTILHSYQADVRMMSWEVEYTIYERPVSN